ncbi:related to Pas7p [Cephalotrichum gorgonifer]|uniref:DNA damage-binding protein CMR1 n=1 Tax=Cephalotrichum gorgonifer TaxID=2041049 RepID=A0AAE8N635_9PEZI|nr:related to Pas7p [Cephalotrichum gorgonifer]
MSAADGTKPMSAFERRRLENKQANTELINELSTAAKKVIPVVPKPAAKPTRTRRKDAPSAPAEAPRRTRASARLAGIESTNELDKRKFEESMEEEKEKQRAKRMRVGGDLDLGSIGVDGKKWEHGMKGLGDILRGAQPGLRTFKEEDIKETTDKDLKALREKMGGLELYEKWSPGAIKITPQRVYTIGLHPTEDKPIIFAGDKEGAMGVFDASQDGPEDEDAEPQVSAFQTHSRTISSFLFSPSDPNAVFSASYDSSIRKLDIAKSVSVQVYAPADPTEDAPISAIDMASSDPNLIYFSTLQGVVGRHDLRDPKKTDQWYLSQQKIGGFSLNPLNPHLLATASLDRTVKIWDLRKISGKGDDRTPALLAEHESRLSISHAAWSPGGHVATSSYDNTVKIYSFPDCATWKAGETVTMEPAHIVPHNNQTGRWVTILKPQWQQRPKDGINKFVIGNMNRFVDVFAADGSQLAQLGGEDITAVPAAAQFHPSMDWVAGGTASGKLCLWM